MRELFEIITRYVHASDKRGELRTLSVNREELLDKAVVELEKIIDARVKKALNEHARINIIGNQMERINVVGKVQPRIDPSEVAKALGAESTDGSLISSSCVSDADESTQKE